MNLSDYIRRWQNAVSYVRPPWGPVKVLSSGGAPLSAEAADAFTHLSTWLRTPPPDAPAFSTSLRIRPETQAHFSVDGGVLGAVHRDGARLIKFSWEPRTGETLLVTPGLQHATAEGAHPFDDYLRAIVLHDHRIVAFRPYWPQWARASVYAEFGADDAERSYDAQLACEKALVAAGTRGWTFRFNITNIALESLTGTPANRW